MNDSLMQGAWPEAAPASLDSTDDASLFLLQHAGQHVHARGCTLGPDEILHPSRPTRA
jgi:isochorismate synthase